MQIIDLETDAVLAGRTETIVRCTEGPCVVESTQGNVVLAAGAEGRCVDIPGGVLHLGGYELKIVNGQLSITAL